MFRYTFLFFLMLLVYEMQAQENYPHEKIFQKEKKYLLRYPTQYEQRKEKLVDSLHLKPPSKLWFQLELGFVEELTKRADYERSIKILDSLQKIVGKHNIKKSWINVSILYLLGGAYNTGGYTEKGANLSNQALEVARSIKDTTEMVKCLLRVGEFYKMQGLMVEAKDYYRQARKMVYPQGNLSPKIPLDLLASYYHYWSGFFEVPYEELSWEKRSDSMVRYAQQAVVWAEKAGDWHIKAHALNQIGWAQLKGQHSYFSKAAAIWKKLHYKRYYVLALINECRKLYNEKSYENLKSLLDTCKQVVKGSKWHYLQQATFYYHRLYFEAKHNKDSAMHYNILEGHSNIAVLEEQKSRSQTEILEKYNSTQKAKEIEQQQKVIALEQSQKQIFAILTSISAILLVVVAFFSQRLYKANQAKEKFNKGLSEQLIVNEVLLSELHHRVKNNLQTIVSLLELDNRQVSTVQAEKIKQTIGRIRSIAIVHDLLSVEKGKGVLEVETYMHEMVEMTASLLGGARDMDITIECDKVQISYSALIYVGIVLNELLTNSFKYALAESSTLLIHLTLKQDNDFLLLTYQDNGQGYPQEVLDKKRRGTGMYIFDAMNRQLKGNIEFSNQQGAFVQWKISKNSLK